MSKFLKNTLFFLILIFAFGLIKTANAETRYLTSSYPVIYNGVTGYLLGLTQTTTTVTKTKTDTPGNVDVSWGIRVFKITSAGGVQEINTPAGTPVAVVTRLAGSITSGPQSMSWTPPATVLASTDTIVVRVYMKFGAGAWVEYAAFTTAPLNASQLNSSAWTVYYYTNRNYNLSANVTLGSFYFGNTTGTGVSYITGFAYTQACIPHTFKNATSTVSPASVNPGGPLTTTCDYGEANLNCINSSVGGNSCNWAGFWTGTAANFTCTAPTTPGNYTHVCTMITGTTSNCCGQPPNSDGSVTVNPTTYPLTITKAGTGSGTVTSNPAGINCGATCSYNFNTGTPVTLTATPAAGSTFASWSGACTGTGTCVVTMTAARAVTATFNLTVTYPLAVTKFGTGSGTVTSNPAGINCGATCSYNFNTGTPVTLTATPAAGSAFAGWGGTGGCTGTLTTCTVNISNPYTVTATFNVATSYPLAVTKLGLGSGTVTSVPAGINCGATCSTNYNIGTSVTLTAAPAAGSTFTGWGGGGCTGVGTCTLIMNANTAVVATFNITVFPLTVTKIGTGSGTVTSNPPGIDCGATCSFPFNAGTPVTLIAAPAAGYAFTGWGGTGGCTGFSPTCVVNVNTAWNVTAAFNVASCTATLVFDKPGGYTIPETMTITFSNAPAGSTLTLFKPSGEIVWPSPWPVSGGGNETINLIYGNPTGTWYATLIGGSCNLQATAFVNPGPGCTVVFDQDSYNVGQIMNVTYSNAPPGSTLTLKDSSGVIVWPSPWTVSGGSTLIPRANLPGGPWKVELSNVGSGCYAVDTAEVIVPPCQVQFDLGVYTPPAIMHIDFIDGPPGSTLTLFKPGGGVAQTASGAGTGFLDYDLVASSPSGNWKVTLVGGSGSCNVQDLAEVKPLGCDVNFANDDPPYVFGSTVIISYTNVPPNSALAIFDSSGGTSPAARQRWFVEGSSNVTWAGTIDMAGNWLATLDGVGCTDFDQTTVGAAPTCASAEGGRCDRTTECGPEGHCICANCYDCRTPIPCCCVKKPCVADGCNGNCPLNCTVAQDPDCKPCQGGNGCCGAGCDNTNDSDCLTCSVTFDKAAYILGNTMTINYKNAPANTSLALFDNTPSEWPGYAAKQRWIVEGSDKKTYFLETTALKGNWLATLEGTGCTAFANTNVSASCLSNGCNGDCPLGCEGNAADPDCVCQDGDSCCGNGCKYINDKDCPTMAGGLVPCGRAVDDPDTTDVNETAPCTLCHFFVLFKRIVDFATINILFPLAVLMLVVGGMFLLIAGGDPGKINQGKAVLKATVIGIVIVLAAWLIVDTIIMFLTPADSPFQSWNTINCTLCGDGNCDAGETTASCPVDCP